MWFGLIGALLLWFADAHFLLFGTATTLPIVETSVPAKSFFFAGSAIVLGRHVKSSR